MSLYYFGYLRGFKAKQMIRAIELGLALPGSGARRWRARYFRPSRPAEWRENCQFLSEKHETFLNYGVRLKGRIRNLPDPWDDLPRFYERNWKSQRSTRWK